MSLLQQLPEGARVCVIRLRSMGDCVLTTPALSLLKQFRPDVEIGVVVEPQFKAVFEGNNSVSTLLEPHWTAVHRWQPELCVNFHGGTRSIWMTLLSGAKWRAGFAHHSFTFAYNLKIGRAQNILGVRGTVHTAEHLASAMFYLGVPAGEIPRAAVCAGPTPIEGRYAVLHPFAAAAEKTWPAEKFRELARYLELIKLQPIFLAAKHDDPTPFAGHRVFRGTLEEAKAVISGCALFIGNDSGPAHLAAACGRPSVVIFGSSKPAIWGPWRTESEIVVAPEGIANAPVSRVVAALERLRSMEDAHA
jgi:heptosyltransferase III